MEQAETKTKEQEKKILASGLGGNMVSVQVELFEPYVIFAKEYLDFFKSEESLEIFCMRLIYDGLQHLHLDLDDFVKNKTHFLNTQAWFMKNPHMGIVEDQPEDED